MSLPLPARVAEILLVGLAIVFAVGGWRIGLWGDDGPGPGLLPLAAALLLLPLIGLAARESGTSSEPFRPAPFVAIGLCCAFMAAVSYFGFALPLLVLVAIWVRTLHGQSWVVALLASVGLTAAGLGLFAGLLKVPLPLLPSWS